MSAPVLEPDDNITAAHSEREEIQRKAERRERLIRQYEESLAAEPVAAPADAAEAPTDPSETPEGGLGKALTPYPTQMIGGALEALQQAPAALRDMSDWLGTSLGLPDDVGIVFGGDDWISIKTGDEYQDVALRNQVVDAIQNAVPDIAEREDGGGSIPRAITQFVTGFALTKKLPGVEKLAQAGRAGQFASASIRGAVADMASFDPHEARLSNLVQAYPALENPITEYMAADPDDSAAEGRFKNALEGLGLGTMLEGVFRGVRAIAKARRVKAETGPLTEAADEIDLFEETVDTQRAAFTEALGDPERPLFEIREVEGVSAADIVESGESGASRAPDAVSRGTLGEEGADIMVNWARIDGPDDVKAVMQDMADALSDRVDEARGGSRVTFADMELSAQEVDAFEALSNRRAGAPLAANEALAARELWGRSSRKLLDLAREVEANPSDINQISFRKMLAVHAAIQDEVIAARTATARALASWRIPMGNSIAFSGQMDQLQALMQSDRATVKLAEGLRRLHDIDRVDAADKFVYGAWGAKTADVVADAFYFSILSGPHTQARNLISNAATIPLQVTNRRVAAWLSRNLGSGEVTSDEAAAMIPAAFNGLRDAFRISRAGRAVLADSIAHPSGARESLSANADEFGGFWRAAATGKSGYGVGKVDERPLGAFHPEKWRVAADSPAGAVLSFLDTAASVPTRGLAAGDEIFKTAAHRMEIHARAVRQAMSEVRAGELAEADYADRVATLINEPDEAVKLAALDFAQESTFTLTPPRDSRAHDFIRSTSRLPVVGKLAMPFTRITYNLGRFTFRHTPLAPILQSYKDAIARGGADAEIARAQMLTGSALLAVAADLTLQGRLTGDGPADAAERAYLKRSGWKPNSAVVGPIDDPRYISLRGLEPVGGLFMMAANLTELLAAAGPEDSADLDKAVMAAGLSIANKLTFGSYMYGAQNTVEALSDPTRFGESYFKRIAATTVPTAVATYTYSQDPVIREAETLIDAAKARWPGTSKDLPGVRDIWGRPITRESGLGKAYDVLSPLYSSKWDPEPIDEALAENDTYLSRPDRKISIDGVTIDLGHYPGAYSEYLRLTGQEVTQETDGTPIFFRMTDGGNFAMFESSGGTLLEELNDLVTGQKPESALYQSLSRGPDGGRAAFVRRVVREYQRVAREHLAEAYPEIARQVRRERTERAVELGPIAEAMEEVRQH